MKRKIYTVVPLFLFLLSVMFFGCDVLNPVVSEQEEDGVSDLHNKNGLLIIKLTDAPFPISLIKEANVAINKIEIRKENEGFITISEKPDTFNLINLRNGITEEIAKLEIPVGTYDHVRVYSGDATIALKDGKTFNLKIPSGAQSGIKIFFDTPIVVEGGITAELLIDFDLEKSFVVQGNPDTPAGIKGFHFSPVLRAVNNSKAGRLTGIVKNDSLKVLADAKVWIKKDTIVSSTLTKVDGTYALIGIPAGTYSAFATKTGYDTVSVSNVNITVANQTILNFTLKAKK
jgi:hypothetical protein